MRRSSQPRVHSQGEVLFEAHALRAQLVNLSRGGLCARGELPTRLADSIESRPEVLRVALGLLDGRPPISAQAKLAWVRGGRDGEALHTFGLSFVGLSGDDRSRLDAAITARLTESPEPAMTEQPPGEMRLRLPSGAVLRAEADSIDGNGLLVGAELPWLRVGAKLEAEVDGVWRQARSTWVGLDVAPSGATRLRMRVEFDSTVVLRDTTLPYFYTGDLRDEAEVQAELDAIPDGQEEAWARERLGLTEGAVPTVAPGVGADGSRGHLLVRLGKSRRVRLALLRLGAVLLVLGAMLAIARLVGRRGPAVRDVPADVHPIQAAPTAAPLVESGHGPDVEESEAKHDAVAKPRPRAAHPKKPARKRVR